MLVVRAPLDATVPFRADSCWGEGGLRDCCVWPHLSLCGWVILHGMRLRSVTVDGDHSIVDGRQIGGSEAGATTKERERSDKRCWKWYYSFIFGKRNCLPLCLSLCRSTAREIWFIKQSSASASPSYVVQTHTHAVPRDQGPPSSSRGDVPFPIPTLLLCCVSLYPLLGPGGGKSKEMQAQPSLPGR